MQMESWIPPIIIGGFKYQVGELLDCRHTVVTALVMVIYFNMQHMLLEYQVMVIGI